MPENTTILVYYSFYLCKNEKTLIEKMDNIIKIKDFCASNDTIKKIKR